jgi:hypothetical protein
VRLIFLLASCAAVAAPNIKWSDLPLSFESNTGQFSNTVKYMARGSACRFYLAPGETVMVGQNQRPLRTR